MSHDTIPTQGRTDAGPRLSAAVVFVRELARSEDFYRELLEFEREIASSEAVLLAGPAGDHLVLRGIEREPRPLGGGGVE